MARGGPGGVDGKLPSVDHGPRNEGGRDKKIQPSRTSTPAMHNFTVDLLILLEGKTWKVVITE
jgi:hypothetical protein